MQIIGIQDDSIKNNEFRLKLTNLEETPIIGFVS